MLIVLGLIGTPNMLVFIVKSFRGDDVLDTIFGYIMVAMLISFWVGIVIELIKSKKTITRRTDTLTDIQSCKTKRCEDR